MLRDRLAMVSKEQEEEKAVVRRLQDAVTQHEREKLQQQAAWKQEKQPLEAELCSAKEKVRTIWAVAIHLSHDTIHDIQLDTIRYNSIHFSKRF